MAGKTGVAQAGFLYSDRISTAEKEGTKMCWPGMEGAVMCQVGRGCSCDQAMGRVPREGWLGESEGRTS